MKLDRFRAPALAAAAVLLISGAGIAFAGSPSAVAPAPAAPIVQSEPAGPDTDTLQQGDQTTPDVAGAVDSAVTAKALTASTTTTAETAPAGSEGSEVAGAETDGSGGHQDPAGQNVDHQFDGEE